MLWHLRGFDFTGVDPGMRESLEARLRSFEKIPSCAAVRVGPDLERPEWTVLMCAFHKPEDLEVYRVHPDHLAFGEAMRSIDPPLAGRLAVDLVTDDDATFLEHPAN